MESSSSVRLDQNLIFVSGKGGVGKTVVSQAIALRLSQTGRRVLWATFEDPLLPEHRLMEVGPGLFHFNCEPSRSFEEYAAMKIGVPGLARIFLHNKVMQYLAKAAPGIHELVLLGKVWHERLKYDHVVIDMPSTGYGLAMFQSTRNFAHLFRGGPVERDAQQMLQTFNDARACGHVIISLPEEMPLRESLELRNHLSEIFPNNAPEFIVNRVFPDSGPVMKNAPPADPDQWPSPVAKDGHDYAAKRVLLESFNLKIWEEAGIHYARLGYEAFKGGASAGALVEALARQIQSRGYA